MRASSSLANDGALARRHRNGSVKWVVERGRGVFDEEGNLLYVDGVVLDNTAIKAAQEEISRTRGQLVSAIESLDVGFVMYDQDERLLICNQTFREMHPAIAGWLSPGMPYEFIARAHYQAGAPDANGMDEETWLQQKLEQQRTGEGVREIQVGDRWIRREDSRTEDGLHVSLRTDITPLKQLMLELMHAKEAAEAASLAKSQFLANMSHEIRTPMNGIIGMTELALDTQLDAEQEEYLQLVRSSANSLLVIINDILDFSKIEAGKLHIDAIPFSLRNTLADTLKSLALRAHEKGLELVSIIDTAVPDQLRADPGRLRQLIINLMGNAIKFTEAGEIEMRIGMAPDSMRSDSLHRKLHVSIRDTGIGIPQEKLGLIFEAFSQADTSTTRRYGGTGLGLAISSRLVELMGGKLWVESELGVGSTFHFTIEVEIIGTPIQTPSTPRLAQVQGMRVLMVDDNATNRRWLTQLLSGWGMRPTIAASGAEALDIVNRISEPFSLILLDGSMPEMSGFDVAESLSRRHDINATTIMMLTSSGERGDATRCGELGIDGYLVKPISQTELLDAILIALGQHQAHQAQEISKPPLVTRHVVAEQRYRLHILLVEDNPVNQKLAVRLLEKLGHRIVVAENGQEALDFSADGQFDLVLMDVQMPVMGGLEATRLIREREAGSSQHLPIVAMTANAMQGDREICLQAGMDGYVSKPINPQILIEEIDRVLDRLGNPDAPAAAAAAVALTVTEVINFDAIDMKEALARLGGDRGLLREIANIFLDDYPKRLEEVRAAISVEDGVQLSRAAHNIKGVAGNLSANPLREVALEMEAAGKRGDIGHARNLLRDLEKRLSELARVLENLPRD
ncbi:response regulator [Parachitinimonas caeni]|uniref:histidine kinase n=1 Tax=Parachitinimonas caeni TaxID=3031301 RepID=A0ABT7DXS0_9NEIS|nr:response regulator [Parachitinimonas caeni]MDK2123878.1 response regulator [Parachitinimonas caeni]